MHVQTYVYNIFYKCLFNIILFILGIVVGVVIAGCCVFSCIVCMIFRRRCIKLQGLDHARVANPQATNGQSVHQPQSISTVPNLTSCQTINMDRQCPDAEVHELQCLVGRDGATTHIPPLVHSHLDTKVFFSFY